MKQKIADYVMARKSYFKVFAVYLLISLVMFWQVTVNLFSYVINGHGDVYQTLFNLWWTPYSLFTLHQSPYFTNLLFYPVGANLVTQTLTPLAGLFSWPLQWISSAFAYNVLFFSSFALSGLFMFAFANYFIKNKYAAFLAGLIFAFSPMHIAQGNGHLDWTIIEWVPLFLLFYVKAIDLHKVKYALLAAVSFVLITFMGDIEQGIMVFVATVVFSLLYLIFERRKLLNKNALINLGYFIVFTVILCIPFLIMMGPYLSSGAFSSAQSKSTVLDNMQWSNNLMSFFLPSYYNGIFHSLSLSYLQSVYGLIYQGAEYQINTGDRTAYAGYTVLVLVLFALYEDYKHNKLRHAAIWLIVGLVFAWLSLGPNLMIFANVTGIPTIYSVYRLIPILNIIREPGRFDLIVTISLAILAAMGFNYLVKDKDRTTAYQYLAVVSILVLIEYNGMPLSGSFASSLITPTQVSKAYYQIGNVPGNFSVLVLPALPNDSDAPAEFIGQATYFVTAMKKPLIGGYTSRETSNQSLSLTSVPLVVTSSYLEQGYGLVYPSPIIENYSNVTLLWLADYNTGFVTVIRSAYNESAQEALYLYLNSSFGNPVYADNTTFVFSTQKALTQNAGKSLAAYTIGNWTPGYDFCNPYEQCNNTLATMWWGDNPRAVILFSPNDENVMMSFTAVGGANGIPMGLYLNDNEVGTFNFTIVPKVYTVNMTVSKGFNQLAFYSPAGAEYSQEPELIFGVKNITFSQK